MEFKLIKKIISKVKKFSQFLKPIIDKIIYHGKEVSENGVFADNVKDAYTDVKSEYTIQKEKAAKATSQEAEAEKEAKEAKTTQEETTTDTTKESKTENPVEGIEKVIKQVTAAIVVVAEVINLLIVTIAEITSVLGSIAVKATL